MNFSFFKPKLSTLIRQPSYHTRHLLQQKSKLCRPYYVISLLPSEMIGYMCGKPDCTNHFIPHLPWHLIYG